MARLQIAASGRTLGRIEGLPALRPADLAYRVRRAALTGLSIGALIAGLTATSAALEGVAASGVTVDPSVASILHVSPTGYGWRSGIRPGQVVTSIVSSDEPGGWRIETRDADGSTQEAIGPAVDGALRATLPISGVALAFACLALLFLSTRRRWVVPAAAIALFAASIPLWLEGGPEISTAVMGGLRCFPPRLSSGRSRAGSGSGPDSWQFSSAWRRSGHGRGWSVLLRISRSRTFGAQSRSGARSGWSPTARSFRRYAGRRCA